MGFKRFEEINAWLKAQDLAFEIYKEFKNNTDYQFRNQICSASVSVSNNIAEGFERSSNKDFIRFLYISLGSCSEVKSMLYLAPRLDYISTNCSHKLRQECTDISKMLTGLISYLKKN